ncbi:MAG: T4 RnlA family RNA ligase [Candidatus Sericytochromatia bacterium]
MAKIDLEKFESLIEQGYINKQKHPIEDLFIFNYSTKTQYESFWNDFTKIARGLITDKEGNIVARPFPKFFNLEEDKDPLPNENFEVFDKLDGSLGILYFIKDEPFIATRGSFDSFQAIKANEILKNKYKNIVFNKNYTYLFEIIYPENRIVVDYKGLEDLILIAIIDTESGKDLELQDLGMPIVKKFDGVKDIHKLRELEDMVNEGFVIKFKNDFRVKLKFTEYIRLHRIVTYINSRIIWENLKDKKPFDEILDKVPDEFYKWVKKTIADLENKYSEIENICKSEFKILETRKETAEYFNKCSYSTVLFKMLDNKDYSEFIWRQIKPKYERAFALDES